MRSQLLTVMLMLLSTLAGCSASSSLKSEAISSWVCRQGGEIRGQHLDRAHLACDSVLKTVDQNGEVIRLYVINSDAVAAYAWPTGDVYLSRSLVDLLSDDEIAAAVAHELGHLVGDGHLNSPVALDGSRLTCQASNDDEEHRADLIGCEILTCCRASPDAMTRMLKKVHDAQPPDSNLRSLLRSRLAALGK